MPVVVLDSKNSLIYDGGVNTSSPNTGAASASAVAFGSNGGVSYRGYLMFDIGTIPIGSVINSATLKLTASTSAGGVTEVEVFSPTQSWKESVTYNTQPTMESKGCVSTVNFNASTIELDVKNIVQGWVNLTSAGYGFCLMKKEETGSATYSYFTRESGIEGARPILTLDYTPPNQTRGVQYISGSSATFSPNTTFLINKPANVAVDDTLFVSVRIPSTSIVLTKPTGWLTVSERQIDSGYYGVYYKKLTQADMNDTIMFKTNITAYLYASLAAYRGADSVTPFGANYYNASTYTLAPLPTKPNALGDVVVTMNLCSTLVSETSTYAGGTTNYATSNSSFTQTYTSKVAYATEEIPSNLMTTSYGTILTGIATSAVLNPILNEPPTPPTNVTVDKTAYTSGETILVDYTPGTDPDGTVAGYSIQQYYPNLNAWGSRPLITYDPPNAVTCGAMLDTNVSKVRVATVDDKGMMSDWVESPAFSVKQKDGVITVPTMVTSGSFYNLASSPLVRFENGWFGQVVRNASGSAASILLSKDGGKKWDFSGDISGSFTKGWSIASNGNMLYIIYPSNGTTISVNSFDVTEPMPNALVQRVSKTVAGVVDTNSLSLVFNRSRNTLSYAVSAKFSAYSASFNVGVGEIKLLPDGHVDTTTLSILTTKNSSSSNYTNVDHDLSFDGTKAYVVSIEQSGSSYYLSSFAGDIAPNVWNARGSYISSTIVRPTVRFTPNGHVHVFAGMVPSSGLRAIYMRSATLGLTWEPQVDLGVCTDVGMTVDSQSRVYVYIANGNGIFLTSSTDGFATFPASKVVTTEASTPYQYSLSPLKEPSLKTVFTVPPLIFRRTRPSDSAQIISFVGTWQVAEPPTVTLTSPSDNIELIEGQTYKVEGSALSSSKGSNVIVTVSFPGSTNTIASYISDGVTPFNFSRTYTYKNKQMFDDDTAVSGILQEGTVHKCIVFSRDTSNSLSSDPATRNFKVKYNQAPVISGTNQDLGAFTQIPSVNYSATDPEANTFTFTEYLNGKQIRSFAGVAGQQYTVEISHDAWIRLDLDVQHQIKIVATDSAGISSERIYTFTRTETHIEFLLDYGNPDMKADFTLDGMPLRVLVTLERYLPEGSSIESVKVCNNYLDDVPTWEDCTNAVKANRGYLFTNKNKTAPEWAINLWVTINKGTARERVLVNGYGGAFD